MSGCLFCRIAAGSAPAARVGESDAAIAFLDLFPVAEGHCLVIPRRHAENLFDIEAAALAGVHRLARRVARAQRTTLAPDGLTVLQNNGAAAGQTVFHYHVHLIPRVEGSTLRVHGRARADETGLEALAARLRGALPPEAEGAY